MGEGGVSSTNYQGKKGEGSSLIVDATPHHLESGALKLTGHWILKMSSIYI